MHLNSAEVSECRSISGLKCPDACYCGRLSGPKKPFFVPTDELLRAKDDLLSEGGQSLL